MSSLTTSVVLFEATVVAPPKLSVAVKTPTAAVLGIMDKLPLIFKGPFAVYMRLEESNGAIYKFPYVGTEEIVMGVFAL